MDLRASQQRICLLETLTNDAWSVLVSFLDSTELVVLWEACNSRLLRRMADAVTEFEQLSYKAICFPALRSFKLRKLHLTTFHLFINPFDLMTLPHTLEDISLSFPSAQNCWLLPPKPSSFVDESLAEPIALADFFPSLHTLRLLGRVWTKYDLWALSEVVTSLEWTVERQKRWMKGLPTSLTSLHLADAIATPHLGFDHLTNLRELEITGNLTGVGWSCPASLEALKLPIVSRGFNFVPSPLLTRLSIQADLLDDIVASIPASVLDLTFQGHFKNGGRDLARLPTKNLESFKLVAGFAQDLAFHLPRSLKHLTVETWRYWPWYRLPPALETLVCGTSQLTSTDTTFSDDDFEDLPTSLKTLNIACQFRLLNKKVANLPPGLTSLTLKNANVTKEWALTLPSTLSQLTVRSLEIDVHAELLLDHHLRVQEEIDESPIVLSPAARERRLKLHLPQVLVSDLREKLSQAQILSSSWVMTGLKDASALLIAPTVEHVVLFHPPPITWAFVTNLSSVLRNLISLELWTMAGGVVIPALLSVLPRSLTKFVVTTCTLADENNPSWAATLPRGLLDLQIGAKFKLSQAITTALPRHLTKLILRSAFGEDLIALRDLPPTLKSLHLPDFGRTGRRNLLASYLPPEVTLTS